MAGKGQPKTGGGSRLNRPNRVTANARAAIAALVDNNIPRMQAWLDEIAEKDGPQAAWRCMQDVIEYHIPKLSRTELANADGEPFVIEIQRFGDAPKTPG